VKIATEREIAEWVEGVSVSTIDGGHARLILSRVVWQEARPCGISAVSAQAFCFLLLRLDMQRGVTG